MAIIDTGYSVAKANDTLKSIEETVAKIKNEFKTKWDTLQTSLRTYWVGEDEAASELIYANHVRELWKAIYDAEAIYGDNVIILAEGWKAKTESGGLSTSTVEVNATINENPVQKGGAPDLDITNEATKQSLVSSFSNDTERGVKAGVADTLATEIDSFHNGVSSLASSEMEEITKKTNEAFVGEEQNKQIASYGAKIQTIVAELATAAGAIKAAMYTAAGNIAAADKEIAAIISDAAIKEENTIKELAELGIDAEQYQVKQG